MNWHVSNITLTEKNETNQAGELVDVYVCELMLEQ